MKLVEFVLEEVGCGPTDSYGSSFHRWYMSSPDVPPPVFRLPLPQQETISISPAGNYETDAIVAFPSNRHAHCETVSKVLTRVLSCSTPDEGYSSLQSQVLRVFPAARYPFRNFVSFPMKI